MWLENRHLLSAGIMFCISTKYKSRRGCSELLNSRVKFTAYLHKFNNNSVQDKQIIATPIIFIQYLSNNSQIIIPIALMGICRCPMHI